MNVSREESISSYDWRLRGSQETPKFGQSDEDARTNFEAKLSDELSRKRPLTIQTVNREANSVTEQINERRRENSRTFWSQWNVRRSPTLPDTELSSMLQNYLDENSSCQNQLSYQLRKFSGACQQNFQIDNNNKSAHQIGSNSLTIKNSEIPLAGDCIKRRRMEFEHYSHQQSNRPVDYNQPFPGYHLPMEQHHSSDLTSLHPHGHQHQVEGFSDHTNRSLLLLPNVSPNSLDSGYGGPGSVGSLDHSVTESPLHSGGNIGSYPNSPWAQNHEYLGQNTPYIHSENMYMYDSQMLPKRTQSQFSHFCQMNSNESSTNSSSNVNYYLPNNEMGQPGANLVPIEDDAQFGFGGCSQEEISNIVDQVLNSIEVFPSSEVYNNSHNRVSSGTLCQGCGNFLEVEANSTQPEIECRHCGAKIKRETKSSKFQDENYETQKMESLHSPVISAANSNNEISSSHERKKVSTLHLDEVEHRTQAPAGGHCQSEATLEAPHHAKATSLHQSKKIRLTEDQNLGSTFTKHFKGVQTKNGFADGVAEKKVVGIVEPRVVEKMFPAKPKPTEKLDHSISRTAQLNRQSPIKFGEDENSQSSKSDLEFSTGGGFSKHLCDHISPPEGAHCNRNLLGEGVPTERNLISLQKQQQTVLGLLRQCVCVSEKCSSRKSGSKLISSSNCDLPTTNGNVDPHELVDDASRTFSAGKHRCEQDRTNQGGTQTDPQCDVDNSKQITAFNCCQNELCNRLSNAVAKSRKRNAEDNKTVCGCSHSIKIRPTFNRKKLVRYEKENDRNVTLKNQGRGNDQNSDIDDEVTWMMSRQRDKNFARRRKSRIQFEAENKGDKFEKGVILNVENRLFNSSTSNLNCLEVVRKKNNLKTSLRKSNEPCNNNLAKEEEEISSEVITRTNFYISKIDDQWIYCKERVCAFWTRKPERMVRHSQCHVPDGKHYQCPDCTQRFYSLAKMLKHDRKVHTGVQDYECRVCDAEVTDIQMHMKVHKDEKQFECPECPLQFRHKNSLVRHLCQHTGERPYSCDNCDSAFISMHRLKEHSRKCQASNNNNKKPQRQSGETIKLTKSPTIKVKTKSKESKPSVVQEVQTDNIQLTNTGSQQIFPTIVTSLPTCMPILVQAANGQVFLLSTPSIQPSTIGNGIYLPNSANIEMVSQNQTFILPSHQQQHQPLMASNFLQFEAKSLMDSALQAAASASAIAAKSARDERDSKVIEIRDKDKHRQQTESLLLMQQEHQN